MQAGLREVDRDNLPAFLGCSDQLLPFFQKFGFEVIGEFEYDNIRFVCLYREEQNVTFEDEDTSQGEGRPRRSTRGAMDETENTPIPKVYRDGLDDALLGDNPIPGLDDAVDQMLQGFFEKLSKITQ